MNSTLQELTDKIYNEGVVKAQNQADDIIAKANSEAQQIIEKAKADAALTIENADKQAKTLKKNTESEIKLFADQAVNALKSTITDMISDKIANNSVKAATADSNFIKEVILKITQNWIEKGNVSIDTADKNALIEYFNANAKEILNNGVQINEVKGMKTSFAITSSENSYKIAIGESEFTEYFKQFIRPQLKDLLF